LLRIRTETPQAASNSKQGGAKQRVVLTFKQPIAQPSDAEPEGVSDGPYKVREEIEVEVANAGVLTRIFEGLGMNAGFAMRSTARLFLTAGFRSLGQGLLIELDDCPSEPLWNWRPAAAIDRAAEELGYSKRDYV